MACELSFPQDSGFSVFFISVLRFNDRRNEKWNTVVEHMCVYSSKGTHLSRK